MLPEPLHPAIVHFPIVFATLMPILALGLFAAIQRGVLPARSWVLAVVFQALLLLSGWVAAETGEEEEDRVERVVAERHIEEHEEAAERFLWIAGAGLLVLATGLLPERNGRIGRVAGTVATIAVLAAGAAVGHSGGELVYQHGAARAYTDSPVNARGSAVDAEQHDDHDDHDDD